MVKKIIFWGKLKQKNYDHSDWKKFVGEKDPTTNKRFYDRLGNTPQSYLSFEVNPNSLLYAGERVKNVNLTLCESGGFPNVGTGAWNGWGEKAGNIIKKLPEENSWVEISFDEDKITKENQDTLNIKYVYDGARNPIVQRWNFAKQDFSFDAMGSPERRDGGIFISIASKKAEDNEETFSPVVDSILLKGINFDERLDIKNGIKNGKSYTIKGASTAGTPISGTGIYDTANNNRALTLFIDNFERIEEISSVQQTTENNNNNNNNVRPKTETQQNNSSSQSILRERDIDKKRSEYNTYNNGYLYENLSDLVEYKETLTKLDKYVLRTDKESHRQIGEKRNALTLGGFKALYETMTDEEVGKVKNFNESELNKRRELTKLMKEVMSDLDKNSTFLEMPYGSEDKLKSSREEAVKTINGSLDQEPKVKGSDLYEENVLWRQLIFSAKNISEINSIKDKVLSDIKTKRELRNSAKDLTDSIQKAEKSGSASDVKKAVEKAEKGRGLESYGENEAEINKLKEKLTAKDYQEVVKNVTREIMKETGLSEKDLGQDLAKKIQSLNGSQLSKEELKNLEEELVPQLNRKGWLSWIKEKTKLVDEYAEKAQRGLTKTIKDDLKKIRDDLNGFIYDKNAYKQNIYQENQVEVQRSLVKLDQCISKQVQNPSSEGKFPLKTIIPLSLAGLVVVGIGLAIIINKKRKSKIEIEE